MERLIARLVGDIDRGAPIEQHVHGCGISPYRRKVKRGIAGLIRGVDVAPELDRELERFLRDTGCQALQKQHWQIDFSAGTPLHFPLIQTNVRSGMKLAQPFLRRMGVATQEHLDRLYKQVETDVMREDFHAHWNFLQVWGKK